jgi:hypothetical protein
MARSIEVLPGQGASPDQIPSSEAYSEVLHSADKPR